MNDKTIIEALAKRMAFDARERNDVSEDATEFWAYTCGVGKDKWMKIAATVLELMRPKRLAWQRGAAVSANGTKYIVAETDFDDGTGEIWYIYVNGKAAGKLGQHNSDHSAQSAAQDHADEQWLTTTPLGELVGGD